MIKLFADNTHNHYEDEGSVRRLVIPDYARITQQFQTRRFQKRAQQWWEDEEEFPAIEERPGVISFDRALPKYTTEESLERLFESPDGPDLIMRIIRLENALRRKARAAVSHAEQAIKEDCVHEIDMSQILEYCSSYAGLFMNNIYPVNYLRSNVKLCYPELSEQELADRVDEAIKTILVPTTISNFHYRTHLRLVKEAEALRAGKPIDIEGFIQEYGIDETHDVPRGRLEQPEIVSQMIEDVARQGLSLEEETDQIYATIVANKVDKQITLSELYTRMKTNAPDQLRLFQALIAYADNMLEYDELNRDTRARTYRVGRDLIEYFGLGLMTDSVEDIDAKIQERRRISGQLSHLIIAGKIEGLIEDDEGYDIDHGEFTAIVYSRHPLTGERGLVGEYLPDGQGMLLSADCNGRPIEELEERLYRGLMEMTADIEFRERDMVRITYYYDGQHLKVQQVKKIKKNIDSSVQFGIDAVLEGLIGRDEAIAQIETSDISSKLHPKISPAAEREYSPFAKGIAAADGTYSGVLCLSSGAVEHYRGQGNNMIILKSETYPEDVSAVNASVGVITSEGGLTSHASVVARGLGKSCIVGAEEIQIDSKGRYIIANGQKIREGEIITMDGKNGRIYQGEVPTVLPEFDENFKTILDWADEQSQIRVMANADSPEAVLKAAEYGAQGVGLCRTEHMFFGDRLPYIRRMILSNDNGERTKALEELATIQTLDFKDMYRAMPGRPVVIRLLDPPFHEFLPHSQQEIQEVADGLNTDYATVQKRIEAITEKNPMLGHRGARLAVTYPEIYQMQARVIFEAAREINRQGANVNPKILVPFISSTEEFKVLRDLIDTEARNQGMTRDQYQVGTMIEIPRAAFIAGELAEANADFFSFGTNDLTQMTLAYSRDDTSKFVPVYLERGLISADPFKALDKQGVGELIQIAAERGRTATPRLELGLCGEQGADPGSIRFLYSLGVNYISCNPFSIPLARIEVAKATLEGKRQKVYG